VNTVRENGCSIHHFVTVPPRSTLPRPPSRSASSPTCSRLPLQLVAYIAVATAIVFFIIGAARTPTKLLQVRPRECAAAGAQGG
jgi:hypothetical protein